MSMERPEEAARALWQGQAVETRQFSQREISAMYDRFNRQIRWRNGREYAAAALASGIFGWSAWQASDAGSRAGHLLVIAGLATITWQLWTRGGARTPAARAGAQSCLEFHRADLQRQAALLRSVWRWYLAPLLPGLGVLYVVHGLQAARHGVVAGVAVALGAGVSFAVLAGVGALNQRAAARLEAQLAALNADG
jgi:Flp pilus assembly protein TadB